MDEVNTYDVKSTQGENGSEAKISEVKDYRKTSMHKGIFVFENFIKKLENSYLNRTEQMEL